MKPTYLQVVEALEAYVRDQHSTVRTNAILLLAEALRPDRPLFGTQETYALLRCQKEFSCVIGFANAVGKARNLIR